MEAQQFIRKIQFRQGSLTMTIPREVIRDMGMKRGQYVVITLQEGRLVVDLIPAGAPGGALDSAIVAGGQNTRGQEETAYHGVAHDGQNNDDEPILEGYRM